MAALRVSKISSVIAVKHAETIFLETFFYKGAPIRIFGADH